MGDFVNIAEAADMLAVNTRTVRRWLKAGTLAGAVRLPGRGGGEWRIPREAVDRLLSEGVPRSEVNPPVSVPRCQGVRANGEPCGGLAVKGTPFCRHHQGQGRKP